MKKQSFLYLLVAVTMLISACSQNEPSMSGKKKKLTYAAINLNDTTLDADILVAANDRSYMVCDVNYKDKCGTLFFSVTSKKHLNEGFLIYMDSTGTPMMLRTPKQDEYYFKNVTESGCDVAHKAANGEISYFWDVELEEGAAKSGLPRRAPASWSDAITSPFTTWWADASSFDWTWDKHQRKAILPFLAKVTSFAITAVTAVGEGDAIGVLITIYEESLKSGLVDGSLMTYIDAYGQWSEFKDHYKAVTEGVAVEDVKGFAIGKIASTLNDYADDALTNIATFEEISWDIFNHPENHIALSRYMLNYPQSGGIGLVKVTAQPGWYCNPNSLPSWCRCTVDQENNQLNFTVEANESATVREATLLVYPPSRVQPARLTIKQNGYAFMLDPTSLTFTGPVDYKAILVQTNDQVETWRVKSCPGWLMHERSETTIWLVTQGNASGTKTGSVVVEATFYDGSTVTKSCAVRWEAGTGSYAWDNTSWAFIGPMTFNDGSGGNIPMELTIHSVAAHSATMTLGAYSNIACDVSAGSNNILTGTFSLAGVLTGSFTVTRTSETTATCDLRIVVQGDGATGTGTGTLQGTKQ